MPTILLVTATLYRHAVARLPYALRRAGFRVWAVCPQVSAVRYSDHLDGGIAYPDDIGPGGLALVMADAVERSGADALLFGDEVAAGVARALLTGVEADVVTPPLRALLEAWIGGVDGCAFHRSALVERVRGLGIRTPRQVALEPPADAAALAGLGAPIVVKRDHGSGGGGVALVATPGEALDIAARLLPSGTDAAGVGMVVAQEHVAGATASVSFVARGGLLLDGFAYKALHRHPEPFGPASVIAALDRPDLLEMARRVVADLRYSGFGGIDVILPEDGGPPVFLELNARPPQTTHLGHLFGADLARALFQAVSGAAAAAPDTPTARATTVALFPAEWTRDPASPYLHSAHHDVPWHEPRLTAAIMALTPRLRSPG
ncbi:ATP-grasp domain-containing protein [Azospirillum sp. RWY-5-1]|uniref:ATP-grasp domain-containing protein n=1 Tax=Azospirillum oleiclasticum TaxID=2735135 RepID=A0ABX2TIG1_9PROT|nr:ATP-grasp domain-containing protein [Azospirillum oleiclasticum]NYZ16650.1 ATP-grasp domain-containing protein [Azospirillum oleiclasticum]NYZ24137.1 ATP-grasp domain-containing protein [Azospirillum oleiclasticum]